MTTKIGIVQCALGGGVEENIERVVGFVRQAAKQDANIIVTPELLEGPYFCRVESDEHFNRAQPFAENKTLTTFSKLAKELGVVLPISFFERDAQTYYNSMALIDADGSIKGVYRKSHIPDGPGYEEKFYFRPGDTGFKVWPTKFGPLGVGVCWDQWFPEAARAMTLMGADILIYPTAIGSEPANPSLDTKNPWQRVMIGHAVANAVVVAAANRVGTEDGQTFYGSSFIANPRGDKIVELNRTEENVAVATVNLDEVRMYRNSFGFFRDRRPELYGILVNGVYGTLKPDKSTDEFIEERRGTLDAIKPR